MFLTLVLTGLGIVPWDLTGFLVGDLVISFCLVWVSCRACCKGGKSHGRLWVSQPPSCDVHLPPPRGAKPQEGRISEEEEEPLRSKKPVERNPGRSSTRPRKRQVLPEPTNKGQLTPLKRPVKAPQCRDRAMAAGPVILEGSRSFAELNPVLPPSAWMTKGEQTP